MSERVAPRLVLPGVVVTWFVTDFPDPGKADGSHPAPLEPALRQGKLTMAGRVGKARIIRELRSRGLLEMHR